MLPEISEFSFGYAVTTELIRDYPIELIGAPMFPTQVQEGKKGGYDVKLPRRAVPLFLQFKRSDWMKRASAAQANVVGSPHYRMHLRPARHSQQHSLLLELEGSGEEVYYATPRFHTAEELDNYYLAGGVVEQTSFIPPSWIGPLPDVRDHHIAISIDDTQRRFCPRHEKKIRSMPSRRVVEERVFAAARQRGQELNEGFFRSLGDRILARYLESVPAHGREQRERAQRVRSERSPSNYSREVAQMLYGCELLVAVAPPA